MSELSAGHLVHGLCFELVDGSRTGIVLDGSLMRPLCNFGAPFFLLPIPTPPHSPTNQTRHLLVNLGKTGQTENTVENDKNGNSGWNCGGLWVSRRNARTIRNFSLELSQDLVLLDIRKSTFQHLKVNWNFNVFGIAINTLRFVKGLPITPSLFLRCFKTVFRQMISPTSKIRESENLKNPETHFPWLTNKWPEPNTYFHICVCVCGFEVWKVRGRIIRIELAEFQTIWSQETAENVPFCFPDS